MEKCMYSVTDLRSQMCSLACTLACMEAGTDRGTEKGVLFPTKGGRCARGFSGLQINILGVLKSHQDVISYWQIARIIEIRFEQKTTEGAVRGALERLYRQEFLIRQRAQKAQLKGNRYAFIKDPCPHIMPIQSSMEYDIQANTESSKKQISSFLEKKDRENLSISSKESEERKNIEMLEGLNEEDIAFHWPTLARGGFGTDQIRQIIQRLKQVSIGLENVMKGLIHAEWELEHEQMKDKHGNPITSPTSWVFMILAKQGNYPRPKNYISPIEQVERDAKIEIEALKKVNKELEDEQYEFWLNSLSEEKKLELMEAKRKDKFHKFYVPESVILHACYTDYLKNDSPYRL